MPMSRRDAATLRRRLATITARAEKGQRHGDLRDLIRWMVGRGASEPDEFAGVRECAIEIGKTDDEEIDSLINGALDRFPPDADAGREPLTVAIRQTPRPPRQPPPPRPAAEPEAPPLPDPIEPTGGAIRCVDCGGSFPAMRPAPPVCLPCQAARLRSAARRRPLPAWASGLGAFPRAAVESFEEMLSAASGGAQRGHPTDAEGGQQEQARLVFCGRCGQPYKLPAGADPLCPECASGTVDDDPPEPAQDEPADAEPQPEEPPPQDAAGEGARQSGGGINWEQYAPDGDGGEDGGGTDGAPLFIRQRDASKRWPRRLLSAGGQSGAILSVGKVAVLGGAGAMAKSTLAASLAADISAVGEGERGAGDPREPLTVEARNEPWLLAGRRVPVLGGAFDWWGGRRPVLIVSYEDDEGMVSARNDRAADPAYAMHGDHVRLREDGEGGAEGAGPPPHINRFYTAGNWIDILDQTQQGRGPLFGPPEAGDDGIQLTNSLPQELRDWELLTAAVAATKPGLVIIDPVLMAYTGDQSDVRQVRLFTDALQGLAEEHACGILLIAHSTKDTRKGAVDPLDPGIVSGSAAWYDACRGVMAMTYDDDSPDGADVRRITISKANLGPSHITRVLGFTRGPSRAILRFDAADGEWEPVSRGRGGDDRKTAHDLSRERRFEELKDAMREGKDDITLKALFDKPLREIEALRVEWGIRAPGGGSGEDEAERPEEA